MWTSKHFFTQIKLALNADCRCSTLHELWPYWNYEWGKEGRGKKKWWLKKGDKERMTRHEREEEAASLSFCSQPVDLCGAFAGCSDSKAHVHVRYMIHVFQQGQHNAGLNLWGQLRRSQAIPWAVHMLMHVNNMCGTFLGNHFFLHRDNSRAHSELREDRDALNRAAVRRLNACRSIMKYCCWLFLWSPSMLFK